MKVLICGDRNWKDRLIIVARLMKLPYGTTVIHGAAPGADTIAAELASDLGFSVVPFRADWGQYGISAGPIRNRRMLDQKPDLVIAFHYDLSKSKGTADCVREAHRRGIPVEVIR